MKIVILNSSDSAGGAAIASRRLAQALVKAGAKTTMLVQDKRSTEPYIKSTTNRLFFYLRFLLERLSFVPYEKSKKERFWFSTASLGQRIDKNPYVRNADIIHIHWINSGFLSFKSIQKILELNTPIVWTLHDSWIFTGGCHLTRKCNHYENNCGNCPLLKSPGDNDLSRKLWKKKYDLIFDKDITFVCCSNWLKSNAEKSSILKEKKILVIPNTISPEFSKIMDKEALRREAGIKQQDFCIAYGALNYNDENKGFEYFQKALNYIAVNYPGDVKRLKVLLYGNASEEHIKLIPFPVQPFGLIRDEAELMRLLTISDLLVLPSLIENLPNTIMEAFSCRTPVVAFKTGGIPEMIDHLENGYLVNDFDFEKLADGMLWAIRHPDLESCGIKARLKAEQEYLPEAVAQKHINLYSQLIFTHLNRQ